MRSLSRTIVVGAFALPFALGGAGLAAAADEPSIAAPQADATAWGWMWGSAFGVDGWLQEAPQKTDSECSDDSSSTEESTSECAEDTSSECAEEGSSEESTSDSECADDSSSSESSNTTGGSSVLNFGIIG